MTQQICIDWGVWMRWIYLAILFVLSLNLKAYEFPVSNNFQSTLISSFSSYFLPWKPKVYTYRQSFHRERNNIKFMQHKNYVSFDFYPSSEESPLVIILSGLGGTSHSSLNEFYAKLLVAQGFQVISIGNQFNWKFNLAVMDNATPGYIPRDIIDIHEYLQSIFAYLGKTPKDFQRIHLLGYSLGALNAAFLTDYDDKKDYFNFDNVVLVNPPVSVLSSSRQLDELIKTFQLMPMKQKVYLNNKLGNLTFQYARRPPSHKEMLQILGQFPFSEYEAKAMIGQSFNESLAESIFVSELINKNGHINTHSTHYSPQAGLDEARMFNYWGYYQEILLPYLYSSFPNKSSAQLIKEMSLESKFDFLKERKGLSVFHNLDDIILKEEDLKRMENQLGRKLKTYPLGGHLGNIWHEKNVYDLLVALFK